MTNVLKGNLTMSMRPIASSDRDANARILRRDAHRRSRRWLALFALLAAVAAAPISAETPPPVVVGKVVAASGADRHVSYGVVISTRDIGLPSMIESKLLWVAPNGKRVRAGEVVARLDPGQASAALRDQEAMSRSAQAEYALRKSEYERYVRLSEERTVSAQSLAEVRARFERAEQEMRSQQARLASVRIDGGKSVLQAPFDGRVALPQAKVGEWIRSGQPVLRLVDESAVLVRLTMPAARARSIAANARVRIEHEGNVVSGRVQSTTPQDELVEVMVLPDRPLPLAAHVQVNIEGAAAGGIAVPKDALLYRGAKIFVYVVDASKRARRVELNAVRSRGVFAHATAPLKPGQWVVVRGAEFLQGEQTVKIVGERRY